MKSPMTTPYDARFFSEQAEGSLASARAVIPVVLGLVSARSVVDFGCGRGTWLKACFENGVERILGLDGDYVDRETLLIDRESFRAVDLRQPIHLDQRFDLAMCLEVAEHLPKKAARSLVESLAASASVVLFSAALPGQGGVAHVNEQWPAYWERLFAECGMRKHDVVRPIIWRDPSVQRWYRQNLYLFATVEMTEFDFMDRFEPDFAFALSRIISNATFGWSPRSPNSLLPVRRIRSILSRFI